MLLGIMLGIAIALFIGSGTILVIGIARGFMSAAFTGAVIGGTGYLSYTVIVFVFSLIATLFIAVIMKDKHEERKLSP